ncbi:MAG: hypothetical protein LBK50_02230 [Candidatus Nomurabacteria bacterium]|nr:hypothetical protein [Candidatus Nomurabacteria bacterium]
MNDENQQLFNQSNGNFKVASEPVTTQKKDKLWILLMFSATGLFMEFLSVVVLPLLNKSGPSHDDFIGGWAILIFIVGFSVIGNIVAIIAAIILWVKVIRRKKTLPERKFTMYIVMSDIFVLVSLFAPILFFLFRF